MTKTFKFYGVCGNCYKLDDKVWEAIEDESDGYRSYLKSIEPRDIGSLIFFPDPVADVYVQPDSESNGFRLYDIKDNHVWLYVGTDHADDYYPLFRFEYTPKPSASDKRTAWEKFIANENGDW